MLSLVAARSRVRRLESIGVLFGKLARREVLNLELEPIQVFECFRVVEYVDFAETPALIMSAVVAANALGTDAPFVSPGARVHQMCVVN